MSFVSSLRFRRTVWLIVLYLAVSFLGTLVGELLADGFYRHLRHNRVFEVSTSLVMTAVIIALVFAATDLYVGSGVNRISILLVVTLGAAVRLMVAFFWWFAHVHLEARTVGLPVL
jgi:hypothetical protein